MVEGQFTNKRVLMFAPSFFGYDKAIKESLESEGAIVHLYDERPNPTSVEKILIRKARFLVKKKIDKYYSDICKHFESEQIDYIFFVNSEAVDEKSVNLLKKTHPEALMILYMWDSAQNKHIKQYFDLFDRLFSFDNVDCAKYGMTFRPLFFLPSIERKKEDKSQNSYEYDLSFVGTVHSDRAKIILEVIKECEMKGLKYYFYLYIPGKLMYYLRMFTDKSLRKISKDFIHIQPISKEDYARISQKSRCIIDIEHPKQRGLTMRTIEMIGAERKIITTNKSVLEYDFYNPSNQILIERTNINVDKEMIQRDYIPIPDSIYKKYTIKGWLAEIFA